MSAELDLERELRELPTAWPQTPDLAAAVAPRLVGAGVGAAPVRRWRLPARGAGASATPLRRWRPLLVAALVVVVALGGAMAVEPARSAILDWLGFGAVRIERRMPHVAPGRLGAGLRLGQAVSLQRARREAGFPVSVPAALGPPDGVFLDRAAQGGPRVTLTYGPRPGLPRAGQTGVGLLVTELRGRTSAAIVKAVGPGTTLRRLEVGGDRAVFLAGDPHGVVFEPTPGVVLYDDDRLAANVLLVDRRDGVLLRLEGRMDRATAIRIAASAR
jgi:hypothetical protein